MKNSLTLGLVFALLSSAAPAETKPAPSAPAAGGHDANAMPMMMPGKVPSAGELQGQMAGRMEQMWKEFDTNGDGSVSREESTALSNKRFDEQDANHDGKVSKEEWTSFHQKKMEAMRSKMENQMKNAPQGRMPEPSVDAPAAAGGEKK